MTGRPIIAVFGATGSQGGGLIESITSARDGAFQARALTRNVESDAARRIADAGAQVAYADLDDPRSVQAALEGAAAAFVVTNYWAPQTEGDGRSRAERELAQAEVAAAAAKRADVAHVVWSTLEDTRKFLGTDGRVPVLENGYTVPHFDAKAEADRLFRKHEVPTTFLRTTLFYEGFTSPLSPTRTPDGDLILTVPISDQRMSAIAVADIGKVAHALFLDRAQYTGATVSIAGDHLTGTQYAAALSDALGEPVSYRPMSFDEFREQDFPGAVEMGNMFQYYAENSAAFVGARNLDAVRRLVPNLASFPTWLAQHADEIEIS